MTNNLTPPATTAEEPRLFVLVLTYTAPLAAIDAAMTAHRRFLDQHFATGEFLVSGPRRMRVGGVILARASTRGRVEELVAADPFTRRGLARCDVVEFAPAHGPFAMPLLDAPIALSSP